MSRTRFFAILSLVIIAVVSRFIPHPPNFTSVKAITLFSAFYFGNLGGPLFVAFASMFLSDLGLGFHLTMPFVYLSVGLVAWIGQKTTVKSLPLSLVASSLLFFIVTNFGEWLVGTLYPRTLEGLGICYLAALPFLANQLLGDLIYGVVIFGGYSLLHQAISLLKSKKRAIE